MREYAKYDEGYIRKQAGIRLVNFATGTRTDLKGSVDLPPGYVPEDTHELVFAAQGDQLSLWLDGKELVDVRDAAAPTAGVMTVHLVHAATVTRLQKVEYGEPEAGA